MTESPPVHPFTPVLTPAQRLGRAVVDVLCAHGLLQLTVEPDSWPGEPGVACALHNLWVVAQFAAKRDPAADMFKAVQYSTELLFACIPGARSIDDKTVWPGTPRQSESLAELRRCIQEIADMPYPSAYAPLEVPLHD